MIYMNFQSFFLTSFLGLNWKTQKHKLCEFLKRQTPVQVSCFLNIIKIWRTTINAHPLFSDNNVEWVCISVGVTWVEKLKVYLERKFTLGENLHQNCGRELEFGLILVPAIYAGSCISLIPKSVRLAYLVSKLALVWQEQQVRE